ncbi:MAG: transposase [Myxococcota bacterium]
MPVIVTEEAIIDRFRFARWPKTGFCCRVCQHTEGKRVARRPRVFRCTDCGRQTSVTAGTLLHGSKLPLTTWHASGELHELLDRQLPTSSELAERLGVARSTAWLLLQKWAVAATTVQGGFQQTYGLGPKMPFDVRPARTGVLGGRSFALTLLRRVRQALVHVVHTTADHATIASVDATAVSATLQRQHNVKSITGGTTSFDWLEGLIRAVHRRVSLRWLPRWIDSYLRLYNFAFGAPSRDRPWMAQAIALHPHPLRSLDPWL